MQSPAVRVHPKRPLHYIQDPSTLLYARIAGEAPPTPQPAEDSNGAVAARHSHVRFGPWQTATAFTSRAQAEAAFARFIGTAPLEIVRREP